MDQDVFIWGNKERGEEVINELKKRGGINCSNHSGILRGVLYFINEGYINFTNGESILGKVIQKHFTEIKLPEPKEKVHFEPFDKVLVCQSRDSRWLAAFFSLYGEPCSEYKYCTTALVRYKYCIPYKGNEHLNGKKFKTEDIEKYDFE